MNNKHSIVIRPCKIVLITLYGFPLSLYPTANNGPNRINFYVFSVYANFYSEEICKQPSVLLAVIVLYVVGNGHIFSLGAGHTRVFFVVVVFSKASIGKPPPNHRKYKS